MSTPPETTGALLACRGEVLDVGFPEGALPEPGATLEVAREGESLRAEVVGPLTGDRVRALVLDEPWGLRVGAAVSAHPPLSTPVGEATLGRILDLGGRPLDEGAELACATAPLLAPAASRFDFSAPGRAPSSSPSASRPTYWAAVDLLAPVPYGGVAAVHDVDGMGFHTLLLLGLLSPDCVMVYAVVGLGSAELAELREDLRIEFLFGVYGGFPPRAVVHAAPADAPAAARARVSSAAQANAEALARAGRDVVLIQCDARLAYEADLQAQDALGRRLSWTAAPATCGRVVDGAGSVTVFQVQRVRHKQGPLARVEADTTFSLGWLRLDPQRCVGSGARLSPARQALRKRLKRAFAAFNEGWLRPEEQATMRGVLERLSGPLENYAAPEEVDAWLGEALAGLRL